MKKLITPGRRRLLENSKKIILIGILIKIIDYEVINLLAQNVYHKKFGNGKILKLDNDKALIDFEKLFFKKIYLKFLKFID